MKRYISQMNIQWFTDDRSLVAIGVQPFKPFPLISSNTKMTLDNLWTCEVNFYITRTKSCYVCIWPGLVQSGLKYIKVDIQRYLTWIIFREIAQRVHANPSNYNSRPHGKDLCNTKREKIPSPFPFEKPTETRRTRLIIVTSLNGQS